MDPEDDDGLVVSEIPMKENHVLSGEEEAGEVAEEGIGQSENTTDSTGTIMRSSTNSSTVVGGITVLKTSFSARLAGRRSSQSYQLVQSSGEEDDLPGKTIDSDSDGADTGGSDSEYTV